MANQEQYKMRLESLCAVYTALRQTPLRTRRELCDALSLSWGGISELCAALLRCGAITEQKEPPSSARGRTPGVLAVSEGARFLGIDINRMGISLCLTDGYGNEIRREMPDAPITAPQDLTERACRAAKALLSDLPLPPLGIGVAMQGTRTGSGAFCVSFGGETQTLDPAGALRAACGIPVTVHHDPDCMLYSLPVDKTQEGLLMVRLDRGVGLAVCRKGNILTDGMYELGKTVFPENGNLIGLEEIVCNAGKYAAAEPPESRCTGGTQPDPSEMSFTRAGTALGVALGNLAQLIPVTEIALCGELVRDADRFVPVIDRTLQQILGKAAPRLSVHRLTDAALGAARFACTEFPKYLHKADADPLTKILFSSESEAL